MTRIFRRMTIRVLLCPWWVFYPVVLGTFTAAYFAAWIIFP